jgi:hypothetical protein
MNWWKYLESHAMTSGEATQSLPDVKKIADHEWARIKDLCHLNEVILRVEFDESYFKNKNLPRVLATASRTMYLINNEWQPGAINDYNLTGSIIIKINPNVPNGWYADNNTNSEPLCNTGYRFDLRSVIRHELLHGIGISSSIQKYNIGYNTLAGNCYTTSFDHHMKTMDNKDYLQGCSLSVTRTADAYVSGIKLYNPATFKDGSSFSHTDSSGLMYYAIPPMKCFDYDFNTLNILNELGAQCPQVPTNSNNRKLPYDVGVTSDSLSVHMNFNVYMIVFLMLKCLMTRLQI